MYVSVNLNELHLFPQAALCTAVRAFVTNIKDGLDFEFEQSCLTILSQKKSDSPSLKELEGLCKMTQIVLEKEGGDILKEELSEIQKTCQKIIASHPIKTTLVENLKSYL